MTSYTPSTRFGFKSEEFKPSKSHISGGWVPANVAPRELTEAEIIQVTGGMANVGIGATVGAIYGGTQFLMTDAKFSWSGFAFGIGSGAASGAIASMGGFAFAFYGGGLGALGSVVSNNMR